MRRPATDGMGSRRTRDALRAWCRALPSPSFLVAVIPAGEDAAARPERRCFTEEKLEEAGDWLRHRNARGCNPYGRPAEARHVLVDDLCEDRLDALQAAHHVAAVVETSPHSLQAWVTVSEEEIAAPLATAIARHLAARFGGDPGAADAHHLGRLPGLANRKPLHQRKNGSLPWARLRAAPGGVDPGGTALVEEAFRHATAPLRTSRPLLPGPQAWGRIHWRSPAEEHREAEHRVRLTLPRGATLDRSRLDFSVARRLLLQGTPADFVEAVVEAGARAEGLQPAVREAYSQRTVRAALRSLCTPDGSDDPE